MPAFQSRRFAKRKQACSAPIQRPTVTASADTGRGGLADAAGPPLRCPDAGVV